MLVEFVDVLSFLLESWVRLAQNRLQGLLVGLHGIDSNKIIAYFKKNLINQFFSDHLQSNIRAGYANLIVTALSNLSEIINS